MGSYEDQLSRAEDAADAAAVSGNREEFEAAMERIARLER